MNNVRSIQRLNQRELDQVIAPEASWHNDYRDTAYVFFGGLPYELSEGDVITIFSQFGEPVFIKLVRDTHTGKSKGFGFLRYEDQRSTDLAVDNLGGVDILGRTLRVDHTCYKFEDGEDHGDNTIEKGERKAPRRDTGQRKDSDPRRRAPPRPRISSRDESK